MHVLILSAGSDEKIDSLDSPCCSTVSLTCVGRWGAHTHSEGVMFRFNKDLFLFSLEEEGNEEVDSRMGAAAAAAENLFGVAA